MQSKQIEVRCPCCDSTLLIDTLTAQVLRHSKPTDVDALGRPKIDPGRWDEVQERVRERKSGSEQRMEEALDRERSREEEMNDLFERAKRKALGRDPEGEDG